MHAEKKRERTPSDDKIRQLNPILVLFFFEQLQL